MLGCIVAVLLCVTVRGQIVLDSYSSSNVLKVMPVGDSITDDCELNGAWREPLEPLFETNGFPFTFVGRQSSSPATGFTKVNHEGYCGAVVAPPGVFAAHEYGLLQNYLQNVVPGALITNPNPDVILILIGANDIGRGRNPYQVATNDMATLLGMIFSNAPNAQVGLAKITSLQNAGLGYAVNSSNAPVYNAVLQKLVNDRRALGQNVFLADQYSAVDFNTMFMSDHVHPNATGLQAIAREWLTRVQAITFRDDLVTSVLINGGATWKYNDTGQDLGTTWSQTNYDDSGWSSGIARLGYGDAVAATTVSYGAQATNKNVTTYFRRTFVVPPNTAITNLNLRVAQADGAVVYLNGQEIYRTNLPVGQIQYTNQALAAATFFQRYVFYPTNVPVNLQAGTTNWIAAEVHLSSTNAAAMGFDMELIGTGNPGPLIGFFQLSVPSAVNENVGVLPGQGNVTVNVAPANDLVVNLRSSDTRAATVPSSIVIPAGQTNAAFDITVVDDGMTNAGRVAVISAFATSYASADAAMAVHNTDVLHLIHLSIPLTATEGDGTLVGAGNVSVNPTPTNDLVVNLNSSNTSKVTVPATVTIPAGQSNAVFNLTIIDNSLLDGDQVAIISASALNYTNTSVPMTIHDNDTATLVVTLPGSVSEGAGTLAGAGMVSIGTPVAANFVVSLTSSDTSNLVVPAATTIVNGQSSAVFDVTVLDNHIIGGSQSVSVTAHVPNWTDGSASTTILYDDVPDHFAWGVVPSPQLIGDLFPVTITAQDATNNTLNYRLPVTLSALSTGNAPGTNTILNSPIAEQSLVDGAEYVLGYSFTPNTNLKVTGVRSYFGDKVFIWTTNGQLLASQNVVSTPGTWKDTSLPAPVVLLAGSTYLVLVHENGVQYYFSSDLPSIFADGTINESIVDFGEGFPTLADDGTRWYFVDLRYGKDVVSVPVSPGATTNFSSGIWSGSMAVLQAATNVSLLATSDSGASGASAPFNVLGTPRLAISLLTNSVLLSWPSAATGFNLEQALTLPNWSTSSVAPAIVGDRYYVTNNVGSSDTYYRLHKP